MSVVEPASVQSILDQAYARGQTKGVGYRGLVTPDEAWALFQSKAAVIVDNRTVAELAWVGRVPGAVHIEWYDYPGRVPNAGFVDAFKTQFTHDTCVLLLCRTANRSHHGAELLAQAGFTQAYNILEGFEGAKNAQGQRRSVDGWVQRGLPWEQD